MELKRIFMVFLIVLHENLLSSLSSVCKKDEDPFIVSDYHNNKVYADGEEITSGFYITKSLPQITKTFCIPSTARSIAVTNVLDYYEGVYLHGSIGEKLVTNNRWRCVERTNHPNWYKVEYYDRHWPRARTLQAPNILPNISANALLINAATDTFYASKKYYCRVWIGSEPSIDQLFTNSAYAVKSGNEERLNYHLVQSFLVKDILECLTHCLNHGDEELCVSMNFKNTNHSELKQCELNSDVKSNYPYHVMKNSEFDYYDVMTP